MKRISLLFFIKKAKKTIDETVPIYVRITIANSRVELSTKKRVDLNKWNSTAQKVIGSTEEVKKINAYLKTLEQNIYEVHQQLVQEGKVVTTEEVKLRLTGKKENFRSLIEIFKEHNQQVKALVGQEFARGTLERYETSLKHTINFLQWKYQKIDIDVNDINHEFVSSYDFYLRSVRKCANNSTVKYIKNFKKVVRICIANGWLTKDPFLNYKPKLKEVKRDFLSQEELEAIAKKNFTTERLNQVRDIFLFSCYTGLAYADIKKLTRTEINSGVDAQKWIFTSRQKTGSSVRIPLLPVTFPLMKKYIDHPQCINKDLLFPVSSNQKMNAYLKEIAAVCGINKQLTYHIARHTFATTVTLSNGVPIESVSKMLGHSNIRTTQHYAKILDKKVSEDMLILRDKMNNINDK
jgi:site-specific recombinase XerD